MVKWRQKRRTSSWSQSPSAAPTVEAKRWCVTVMLLMESKNIAVNHIRGKVVRIQPPMGRRRSAVKKFYDPIKSVVV